MGDENWDASARCLGAWQTPSQHRCAPADRRHFSVSAGKEFCVCIPGTITAQKRLYGSDAADTEFSACRNGKEPPRRRRATRPGGPWVRVRPRKAADNAGRLGAAVPIRGQASDFLAETALPRPHICVSGRGAMRWPSAKHPRHAQKHPGSHPTHVTHV